jgi:hypothetical protein
MDCFDAATARVVDPGTMVTRGVYCERHVPGALPGLDVTDVGLIIEYFG